MHFVIYQRMIHHIDDLVQITSNFCLQCPQCALMFADNQIIDLYAPANLWEGCGRVQVMFHLSSGP